ncbi:heme NO-binding domain-containing protein [Microcoleus sp. Pol14C6]|uniref:heme NO-binding domain-containing protein n=1 Tax=unclassified Microcoleus TaxID=2642155 RepID=UPI002FD4A65D
MYGLVNRGIQDMVCDRFDEATWEKIKQKAQVLEEQFLILEAYPDDLTHRLVKSASEVLGLSGAEIMQAFGEYWVKFTGTAGYQEILDMAGDTLPEFLENLDDLHIRIGVQFPKLRPPSFECTEVARDAIELHYRSTREGFAPMVVGLVKGLGDRFETAVEIAHTQSREAGFDHDIFRIEYRSEEIVNDS